MQWSRLAPMKFGVVPAHLVGRRMVSNSDMSEA